MSENQEGEKVWTVDPSVLWRDGKWMNVIPRASTQTRPELVNAIARLSIVAAAFLALLMRSFVPIGLGALGVFLSSKMAGCIPSLRGIPASQDGGSSGAHVKRKSRRRRTSRKSHVTEPILNQEMETEKKRAHIPSWTDMFGPAGADTHQGSAMGAYVALANSTQDQGSISYFPPTDYADRNPVEGGMPRNMVPMGDVTKYSVPEIQGRAPFPRPSSSSSSSFSPSSSSGFGQYSQELQESSGNSWQNSSPFQAGFPTQFGPAPTSLPFQAGSLTRPEFSQAAAGSVNQFGEAYQQGTVGFGTFASDGGNTSTTQSAPNGIPHALSGQNFPTINGGYQPHHLAQAGTPLSVSTQCFPPNKENPLGNPTIEENRVARPHLCPVADPRSDSTQFIDQLYESPASIAAGYNFMPFPVQDVVQAREDFQNHVIKAGLTHYKDKYTNPESAGAYNITNADLVGPLGF